MQKVKFLLLAICTSFSICSVDVAAKSIYDKERASDRPRSKVFNVKGVPFNIDLAVTAFVRGDEELKQGIYLFKLKCSSDASCGLERFSLNECATDKDGMISFMPRVDHWNSPAFLEATQLSNTKLELVVYQAFEHLMPAKIVLTLIRRDLLLRN